MKRLRLLILVAFLCFGIHGFAEAVVIDFDGGTATYPDTSTVVVTNSSYFSGVDYYVENGFKLDFVGDGGYIGNYYGPDLTGNDNAVIHAHWNTGDYGSLTSIVVTKLDGSAFDLNYFVLTSNTDAGPGYASGSESAWITASNGATVKLPSEDWGWLITGPYPGVGNMGFTQVYLDSNFDNITSFAFTVANAVDCFGMDSFYIDEDAPSRVPEPITLLLLGLGLAGTVGIRRFKK
jgi:hypothetical protein